MPLYSCVPSLSASAAAALTVSVTGPEAAGATASGTPAGHWYGRRQRRGLRGHRPHGHNLCNQREVALRNLVVLTDGVPGSVAGLDGNVGIGRRFFRCLNNKVSPEIPEFALIVSPGVVFAAEPPRIEIAVGFPGPERGVTRISAVAVKGKKTGVQIRVVSRLRPEAFRLDRRQEEDRGIACAAAFNSPRAERVLSTGARLRYPPTAIGEVRSSIERGRLLIMLSSSPSLTAASMRRSNCLRSRRAPAFFAAGCQPGHAR